MARGRGFGGRRGIGASRFGGGRRGFGARHRFRRHRGRGGGGGGLNQIGSMEMFFDQIGNTNKPPMFFNGTLALVGRDSTVTQQLNQIDANASMQTYQQTPTQQQYFMFPTLDEAAPEISPGMQTQGYPNTQTSTMPMGMPGVALEDPSLGQAWQPPTEANFQYQQQPQMMMNPVVVQPQAVTNVMTSLSVTAVGAKTAEFNFVCFCLTFCLATLLFFPICFMCCMWWKKIVYPMYEMVNTDLYLSVGRFLNKFYTVTTLHLTVCDNSFDAQKARILHEQLQSSQVKNFHFTNLALDCNNHGYEFDEFALNMAPIKELQMTSVITWGETTI